MLKAGLKEVDMKKSISIAKMIKLYCKSLESKAFACLEKSKESEMILNLFFEMVKQKNITFYDLVALDKDDLSDIYRKIKKNSDGSPAEIIRCINIISDFLLFLEVTIDDPQNEFTVHEVVAEYGSHCA
jgi:hypothetical protein